MLFGWLQPDKSVTSSAMTGLLCIVINHCFRPVGAALGTFVWLDLIHPGTIFLLSFSTYLQSSLLHWLAGSLELIRSPLKTFSSPQSITASVPTFSLWQPFLLSLIYFAPMQSLFFMFTFNSTGPNLSSDAI